MLQWVKYLGESNIIRYIFVGIINTILGFIYYSILLSFLSYGYALTIGYIFGISSSYLLNTTFVFKRKPTWARFFQFPVVYIVQYFASLIIIFICVEYLGIGERIAYLIGVIITIPLTFVISRFIITRPNAKSTENEKVKNKL